MPQMNAATQMPQNKCRKWLPLHTRTWTSNPARHDEIVEPVPHARSTFWLLILIRSGRYPGWRKCRFTFPHAMRMQWCSKPLYRALYNLARISLTVAGAAQVGAHECPAALPASRLTAHRETAREHQKTAPSLGR